MPGYVIAGTYLPDGTWVACIPQAVEERWAQGDSFLLQGCEYQNLNCGGGGRYRCHRDILSNLMAVPPPPNVPVRRAIQQAEREEAVAEAPALVRPVARVGAGVLSVAEAAFTPSRRDEQWVAEGAGALRTGVVDPWAEEDARQFEQRVFGTPPTSVAKGGMQGLGDNGPVLYVSKGGDVFGAQGKVGEVQKTEGGELQKTPQGELIPETPLPEGAVVQEASVMPVGPWVYVGVGSLTLLGLIAGGYYLYQRSTEEE